MRQHSNHGRPTALHPDRPGCDIVVTQSPSGTLVPSVFARGVGPESSNLVAWAVDHELERRERHSNAPDHRRFLVRLGTISPLSVVVRDGVGVPAIGALSLEVQMLLSRLDCETTLPSSQELVERHIEIKPVLQCSP